MTRRKTLVPKYRKKTTNEETESTKFFVAFYGHYEITKDRECGSITQRVGVIKKTRCVLSAWKDNKTVSFLPTFTGSAPVPAIKQYHKKAKEKLDIPCPAIVQTYNQHLGGELIY